MSSESSFPEELASAAELTSASKFHYRPTWVPQAGHRSHGTGIAIDVVRIPGDRGAQVSEELIAAAKGNAGPILVRVASSGQDVLFIVPPGTAESFHWPPGVFAHGVQWREYVAVPALRGWVTVPVRWESHPTAVQQYVDPDALFKLVCRLTDWPGGPP
ncbi:hypothetical protein ACH4YO_41045 [Streptomyces noursei]|uniref:hypothetical protein n=1 Tax=Streptomyces noursei TaxID=1971 RepID=UPI0033C9689E